MKKNRNIALIASVFLIVICITILIGFTFAWFTDSSSSGINMIVTGSLDIELEYSYDGNTWEQVEPSTSLFNDVVWEPGHTEVVYLKVRNEGNLALKYQLGINVASETETLSPNLSDYIEFGVVGSEVPFADRGAARNAVKDSASPISSGFTDSGVMDANSSSGMLALVVYMPEEVGNVASNLTTNFGIKLVATQSTSENDSFGSDYDDDASLDVGSQEG